MTGFIDFASKSCWMEFDDSYEQNTSFQLVQWQGLILYCLKQGLVKWIGLHLSALTQTSGFGDLVLENHQNITHTPMTMDLDDSYDQNTSISIKYSPNWSCIVSNKAWWSELVSYYKEMIKILNRQWWQDSLILHQNLAGWNLINLMSKTPLFN